MLHCTVQCTLLVSANLKTICLYNDANAGQVVLYVDDNTRHVTSKYPEALVRKIQQQADKSTDWVKDNKMVCSGEKTKLLIIGTKDQKRNLIEDEVEIKVCDKTVKVFSQLKITRPCGKW